MPAEALEVTVARVEERMENFRSVMEQMADDQRRMAESYEKLVESNQRIALLELDVVKLNASTEKLWARLSAMESAHNADEKSRIDEERKSSRQWIGDLIKMGLATGLGAVMAKLSGH